MNINLLQEPALLCSGVWSRLIRSDGKDCQGHLVSGFTSPETKARDPQDSLSAGVSQSGKSDLEAL